MAQIEAAQIKRFFQAPIRINGISANGGSTVITSAISTALGTAGQGGVGVPVQVISAGNPGVITTGLNRCTILEGATEEPIFTAVGDKVYARLTEASGAYTLTYYSLVNGTETAHSFTSTTVIDVFFVYRFDFYRIPEDFAVRYLVTDINEDIETIAGTTQNTFQEQITVTAANTLNNITKTPINTTQIRLNVNGLDYFPTNDFTVNTTTRALTWNATNAKYSLAVGDTVFAIYETLQ